MRFVTNIISTKTKNITLAEMYKAAQTKAALSKTAGSKPAVKTASKTTDEVEIELTPKVAGKGLDNFGDKKAPPFGQKDKKDKDDSEVEVEIDVKNKDDKKDKKAAATAKATKKAEADEAESSGQLDVEPLHQEGESTGQKPGSLDTQKDGKECGKSGGSKSEQDEAESSGQPEAESKLVNEPKVDKDAGAKAAKKVAFKKIAELTAEEKAFLRGVWGNFWPKAFIDAILKPQ